MDKASAKTEWERAWAARDYAKLRDLAAAGFGKAMDLTDPLYYGDKALEAVGAPKVLQKTEEAIISVPGMLPGAVAGAALPLVTGPVPGFGPHDEIKHHEGWSMGREADPTQMKDESRKKYRERAYADRQERWDEMHDPTEMERTSDATSLGKTSPGRGSNQFDELEPEMKTEKFPISDNKTRMNTETGKGMLGEPTEKHKMMDSPDQVGDRFGRWENPVTESAPLRNRAQIEYIGPMDDAGLSGLFDDETVNDRTEAKTRKPGSEAAEKTEAMEKTTSTRGQFDEIPEKTAGKKEFPSIGELLDKYAAGQVDAGAATEALSKPLDPDDADAVVKKLGGKGAKGVGAGIALAPIVAGMGGIAALATAVSSEMGRMSRPDLSVITMSKILGRPLTIDDIGSSALKRAINSDPGLERFLVDGGFFKTTAHESKKDDAISRNMGGEMAPTPVREETSGKPSGKPTGTYQSERERLLDEALGRLGTDSSTKIQPGQYRGDGGYVYKVDDAGAVTIIDGPTGVGKTLTSGTAYNAIVKEIKDKNKAHTSKVEKPKSYGGGGASYEGE